MTRNEAISAAKATAEALNAAREAAATARLAALNNKKWIVLFGDPVQGFIYHGVFDTSDEACEYGDLHRGNYSYEYWVAPLESSVSNDEGCGKWGCRDCYPDDEATERST